MTPASLGLLLAATAPERRTRAVRIWSASAALAAAAGPGLGGLLVQSSWRWIFLVNVPVGAVALVAGARLLPDVRRAGTGRIPDVFGARR
ncbi:MFS transporter [Streptomyces doebereineriae]|uniref:MFS transporter n=1 Tax=Streptomyces doebereineriae TaxID=3075528 RepID=A0ABU2V2F0_9ACTN|nr:MFS transporter [Streptomyces sp. DSM 41640]MDT0479409.1 MFS transporter [Streptomyces sp. DSM 41640]